MSPRSLLRLISKLALVLTVVAGSTFELGYHRLIPLPNPVTDEVRAQRLWRELRVISKVRLASSLVGGRVASPYWDDWEEPHALRGEDPVSVCAAFLSWRQESMAVLSRRAELLGADTTADPVEVERVASILLADGRTDEAVALLGQALQAEGEGLSPRLMAQLAATHLRDGESRNCIHLSNPDRCLFPIRTRAEHEDPGPAKAARDQFRRLLEADPNSVELRWLEALTARLAGDESAALSEQLAAFERNSAAASTFPNEGLSAGLNIQRAAGGIVLDDFDGDGDLDLLLGSDLPCDALAYFRNDGDGNFEEASHAAGLDEQFQSFNLAQADYDNDGDLDVFVARGGWGLPGRNSLLANDGTGHFTDVTDAAGLGNSLASSAAVAWADFDGDGWVDLAIANLNQSQHDAPTSRLHRNLGDGRFEDFTDRAGLADLEFATGIAWGDVDNDGDPDLYLSVILGPNHLFRNEGDGRFTDITFEAGVERPLLGFPTWFWDYDGDGRLDLFAGSWCLGLADEIGFLLGERSADPATTMRVYRNVGDGTFEDRTRSLGLEIPTSTMGANFGDLDSDGDLDFYLGTGVPRIEHLVPNRLFLNDGGEAFVDETFRLHVGHLQKGHGVAIGDTDGDGDQDLVVNLGGDIPVDRAMPALFRNPGSGNRAVEVRLVGVESNRAAIGARLAARLTSGRMLYRTVSSGGSFGASPLRQHLGLGTEEGIEQLEVTWPSGKRQVFTELAAGSRVLIREGDPTPSSCGEFWRRCSRISR